MCNDAEYQILSLGLDKTVSIWDVRTQVSLFLSLALSLYDSRGQILAKFQTETVCMCFGGG